MNEWEEMLIHVRAMCKRNPFLHIVKEDNNMSSVTTNKTHGLLPSCCGEVVQNTACGKQFYVCRGCKREVPEDGWPKLEEVPKDKEDDYSPHYFHGLAAWVPKDSALTGVKRIRLSSPLVKTPRFNITSNIPITKAGVRAIVVAVDHHLRLYHLQERVGSIDPVWIELIDDVDKLNCLHTGNFYYAGMGYDKYCGDCGTKI